MKPQTAKRASGNRARRVAETALGRDEDGMGSCWNCGRFTYVNGHERLGRSQGGDPTNPDCLLCVPCNRWCEDNPMDAAFEGWKISGKHARDPALEPWQAWNINNIIVTFADPS